MTTSKVDEDPQAVGQKTKKYKYRKKTLYLQQVIAF